MQFVGQSHTSDWIVVNDTSEDAVASFSLQSRRFDCNSPYRHWVQAVDRKCESSSRVGGFLSEKKRDCDEEDADSALCGSHQPTAGQQVSPSCLSSVRGCC